MTSQTNGLALRADPLPLRTDPGGIVRVSDTRVSLDVIVQQYESGMSPEDMVRAYDTLRLADLYAVLAYYLRHQVEVQAYMNRRSDEAETLRARIEAERPRVPRGELLARREAKEADGASARQ